VGALAILVAAIGPAEGAGRGPDFDGRDDTGIRVRAAASRVVEAEIVNLVFFYATESDTSRAALATLRDLEERIADRLAESCAGGPALGHTVASQGDAPISWSRRPTRLEHRIEVACRAEAGSIREAAAVVADQVLALDPGLALVGIGTEISEDTEDRVRRELLSEALARARRKAQAGTQALGQGLGDAVRVESSALRQTSGPSHGRSVPRQALPWRPGRARGVFVPGTAPSRRLGRSPRQLVAEETYAVEVQVTFELTASK